jgi:cell division protein FtsL
VRKARRAIVVEVQPMHPLTVSAAFLAISSAFLLYGLSYDTRQLEARVSAQERLADKARADIAVLKAERAHLGRPSRIEPLARAQGLEPLTDKQMTDRVPDGALSTGAIAR